MLFRNAFKVFALLLCISLFAFAQADGKVEKVIGEAEELQISADDIQHDVGDGWSKAKGNVKIVYGNLIMTSDEAAINNDSGDFKAFGNVKVQTADGSGNWTTPVLSGNFDRRVIEFGMFRLDSTVWHCSGKDGSSEKPGTLRINEGSVSTCDYEHPHYCMTAKVINYKGNKTYSAKHVVLRFWDVPVFYFPYLWGNTDGTSGFIIRPGYSGKKGAYLRLGRAWKTENNVSAQAYVDLMSKRGIGVGADVDHVSDKHQVEVKMYGILDQDAPETEEGYNRRFDAIDERYRIKTYYRDELMDGLTLRLNLDLLSDIDMLEDWYKHDYRRMNQPKTYGDLSYENEYFSAGISVRPRINDFYTVVESLPELRFETPRLDIAGTPFQYEGSTKIGYYSMKWRDFERSRLDVLKEDYDEELHDDPHDYQSWRAHSQHFLYLPMDLGDWAVFTPRAGGAFTYYSRSSKGKVTQEDLSNMLDVDNPDHVYSTKSFNSYDGDGGNVARLAFETGAELRSSIYSNWGDTQSKLFQIDGLRHVLEPYVNYTYAPEPSHDRDHIYYFDDIDRLEAQHFIRLGLDQRLLTRRDNAKDYFMGLQSYIDFHFDRDEYSDRHPGNLGNRLDWQVRKDLTFWTALVHNVGTGNIQHGEAGLRYGMPKDFNLAVKYLYQNGEDYRSVWSMGSTLTDLSGESSYLKKHFEDSDSICAEVSIPINSITKFTAEAEYDFDENKLSSHKYVLSRQLHCWTMGLGVGWDNYDFEAMVLFQLTAFPKVKLNLDM